MKIELLQYDVSCMNPGKNLNHLQSCLANSNADVIVLPEMFLTGFNMDAEAASIKIGSKVWQTLVDTSWNHDQYICGSIAIESNGKFYNRFIIMQRGELLNSYNKNYLFSYSGENREYEAGNKISILDINGWKVIPQICYDLRFPEKLRRLDSMDLIVCSANWPQIRVDHWQKLLMARAIENQCYVIGCNRIGVDGNGWKYSGSSMIIDYSGRVIASAGDIEIALKAEIDKVQLNSYRERYPFMQDKKRVE